MRPAEIRTEFGIMQLYMPECYTKASLNTMKGILKVAFERTWINGPEIIRISDAVNSSIEYYDREVKRETYKTRRNELAKTLAKLKKVREALDTYASKRNFDLYCQD